MDVLCFAVSSIGFWYQKKYLESQRNGEKGKNCGLSTTATETDDDSGMTSGTNVLLRDVITASQNDATSLLKKYPPSLLSSTTVFLPPPSAIEMSSSLPSSSMQLRPVLGLLFAASWCDDCWDVIPVLEDVLRYQYYEDKTVPPVVHVVYISSDRTAEEMRSYKPSVMGEIPFRDVDSRSDMKRRYGACAKKEMSDLNMIAPDAAPPSSGNSGASSADNAAAVVRKHGTPTLILLDTATGAVLSETAVDDFIDIVNDRKKSKEREEKTATNDDDLKKRYRTLLDKWKSMSSWKTTTATTEENLSESWENVQNP